MGCIIIFALILYFLFGPLYLTCLFSIKLEMLERQVVVLPLLHPEIDSSNMVSHNKQSVALEMDLFVFFNV